MIDAPHGDLGDTATRVREFAPRDIPQIRAIARESPQAADWAEESYLAIERGRQFAWVTESGDTIFGFLIARKVAADEGEILNLAFAPSRRRAGYATSLLQACLSEFSRLRIQRVFLEVRESNLPAISFYEKQNFVRTGRRPGYYQNPSEAAVLLMRELTG
jgi:ribosomal-protein-alanine N-acetyltransferase